MGWEGAGGVGWGWVGRGIYAGLEMMCKCGNVGIWEHVNM